MDGTPLLMRTCLFQPTISTIAQDWKWLESEGFKASGVGFGVELAALGFWFAWVSVQSFGCWVWVFKLRMSAVGAKSLQQNSPPEA